tara:strand:- start:214 stop:519 length:306 start_codon:yes stop_codon:yes gene_type:complete
MKITKAKLKQIIKEELAHSSLGAARDPKEVFTSVHESLMQAHKDLQMLSLHLKNGGFDTQPVEKILKDVEHDIVNLNGLVKEDVEKLSSLKGPLERGTRDI